MLGSITKYYVKIHVKLDQKLTQNITLTQFVEAYFFSKINT